MSDVICDENKSPLDSDHSSGLGSSDYVTKAILDQQAADPVQKGPFLTPTTESASPYTGRNVNLMKARLIEQESTHKLEVIQLKKKHEDIETSLSKQLQEAKIQQDKLQEEVKTLTEALAEEKQLRERSVRNEEQTTKDLIVIVRKLDEMQGRLHENHVALDEARDYTEKQEEAHQRKIMEMQDEFSETIRKQVEVNMELTNKVRDGEAKLEEAVQAFQKKLSSKCEEFQEKEKELNILVEKADAVYSALLEEKAEMAEFLGKVQAQLVVESKDKEELAKELVELKDYHSDMMDKVMKERAVEELKWEEQLDQEKQEWKEYLEVVKENYTSALGDIQELTSQLEEVTKEKEAIKEKSAEDVALLKETLTVVDEQNKELTANLKVAKEEIESQRELIALKVKEKNEEVEELQRKSKEEIAAVELQVKAAHEELEGLKELMEKKRIEAEQTIAGNNVEIERLQGELKTAKDKEEILSGELEKMELAWREKEDMEENDKFEMEKKEKHIQRMKTDADSLFKQVVDLKQENIILKNELEEVFERGERYRNQNFHLTAQIAELMSKKAAAGEETSQDDLNSTQDASFSSKSSS